MPNQQQPRFPAGRFGAPIAVALLVVVAAALTLVLGRPGPRTAPGGDSVARIEMTSNPFPMTVGNAALVVSIFDADGEPAPGATISATARMRHEGMIPVASHGMTDEGGVYRLPITWPMTGRWDVKVTATLPGSAEPLTESFDLFVYAVPPQNSNPRSTYVSASELAAYPLDPQREMRIVIPQGTRHEVTVGHNGGLIPAEIRLSLSGQHILIIRNDDLVDHVVGPFFVRAGEVVRQEFRREAYYEGGCSIRARSEVAIIVDA